MKTFQLFSFFHLNLAYSAIEEEQRPAVIQRCYWPLLNLAEKHNLPFSIELSAYTLEQIAAVDPAWIEKFKWLISHGRCELIGCGYAQVIGPLVPADMNAANLRIGMQVYESILGLRPTVALVNEQAALLVKDQSARLELGSALLALSKDATLCSTLSGHISKMGHRDSSERIAQTVIEIIDTTSTKI
jgi:hypothetical protein